MRTKAQKAKRAQGRRISKVEKQAQQVCEEVKRLTKVCYKGDEEMEATVALLLAHMNVQPETTQKKEFVAGLLGFIKQVPTLKMTDGNVLFNLIHDLGEYKANKHEKWFSPRTTRFQQYA